MLWYIIDGWNVIYQIANFKDRTNAKEDFIFFIKKRHLTGSSNNRVTIVFDGRIDLEMIRGERTFEIIFSGHKKADELICSKVACNKNKQQIVVITDDKEIINSVKVYGAGVLRTADFLRKHKESPSVKSPKDISYTTQREINEELRKVWDL